MTKNEFKQQLIISIAGSDYLRTSSEILSKADSITKEAEKAGITFDGDTRQGTAAPSTKNMQNAVVINGTVYELVKIAHGSDDCGTCALREECGQSNDIICNMLFGDKIADGRYFKKV